MSRKVYLVRMFRNERDVLVTMALGGGDEDAAIHAAKKALAARFEGQSNVADKPTSAVVFLQDEFGSVTDLRQLYYQPDGTCREVAIERPTTGLATPVR